MTVRHVVVAALVLTVVTAQLAWWFVYGLRENRHRLELELELLQRSCQHAADQLALNLERASREVAEALVGGLEPAAAALPHPFASASRLDATGPCATRWTLSGETLLLDLEVGTECYRLTVEPGWLDDSPGADDPRLTRREAVEGDASAGSDGIGASLGPALDGWTIVPRDGVVEEVLHGYHGRIVMMVSEGTVFLLLLGVLLALLWKTMRRELELERQHRNFLSAITHELRSPGTVASPRACASWRTPCRTPSASRASSRRSSRSPATDDAAAS